jgi:phospholipid/cholesterol/gamma-HCH transport system substrate-binding protein
MSKRETSRLKHFRAALSRQSRGRSKDTIAIIVLTIAGLMMMLYIFTQQKASLPSWAPLVGEEFAHVTGEFETAQAIAPGQGQAVVIAGIQVGKITSVAVEEGHAVVGMDIEPEYLELIHPDAELLMRPKTNLNDMTVEVSPGTAKGHIEEGDNIPLSQTQSNTSLDAFLATLDADTRQYIQLLVAGGAEGIGGRGRQLSGAFRRFQPFVHYLSDINTAVAQRRVALRRVIHNFKEITEELARRDAEVERFVSGSEAGLRGFARQQQALQESLVEFPATLVALNAGLASSNAFSLAARPSLIGLIPQAQALGPAFGATQRFFAETTVPIRDQIRPFTRQVRPVLTHAKQGAPAFEKTVKGFGNSLRGLNSLFNTLAFKPKGRESYLFYLPWVNHNLNATFNIADAAGPIQRGLVMISCNGAYLGYGASGSNLPFVKTLLQSVRLPHYNQLPPVPPDPQAPTIQCGPGVK